MFSYVWSGGLLGISGYPVRVETDISSGMPAFELVGYLSSEVREAGLRVRTALKNSGINLPVARITVNLSPGDVRKSGTGFDLPIAISVLTAMGETRSELVKEYFIVGELMLSGQVAYTKGILPILLSAKKEGYKSFIIPAANKGEGELLEDVEVVGVNNLLETIEHLRGENIITPYKSCLKEKLCKPQNYEHDFANVYGQALARRGLEIGASGLHNVLMVGPPGGGKTMLARCLPSILPTMSESECLEVSSVYSIRGFGQENGDEIILRRPFVTAHHTSTDISLVGGGAMIKPGAVSMAHNGVLFLDELPEFSRNALEALRQPLEDRKVNITRNKQTCEFPANFMLVTSLNPCPCGYFPDRKRCRCTDSQRDKYMSKISGPLMDRIDLCILTQKVSPYDLNNINKTESSEEIRKRVIKAQQIQKERFCDKCISFNSQMNNEDIKNYCYLNKEENDFLRAMAEKYDMSARSYFRVLKLARTIADLDDCYEISEKHLAEAIRFKFFDRA